MTIRPLALASVLGLVLLLASPAAALAGATDDLQRAIAAVDAPATIKAIGELGKQNDEKAAKLLLNVALQLDDLDKGSKKKFSAAEANDIYDALTAAIVSITDEKAHKHLLDQITKHKLWQARQILVDAIAKQQTEEAEDALVQAVKDKHPAVAGNAIRALLARRSAKGPDAFIEVLEKTEKTRAEPWLDAQTAMVELTGNVDLVKAADWKNFWNEYRKTFDPKKPPQRRATGAGQTVMREAPKFMGKEILSKRVVFILDVSKSMLLKDIPPGPGQRAKTLQPEDPGYADAPIERQRMYRLKEAMVKCIESLPEDTRFSIVTFSNGAQTWNGSTELVPANAKNKADAIEFANSLDPSGFTWTDTALELAFEFQEANTFYLFSDGIPQRGKNPDGSAEYIDRNEILEKVAEFNRFRKVKIHTLGIGEADPVFMGKLAAANDGTFTPVN